MQLPNVRPARQPGKLKPLDKRIDELNRGVMSGDAGFRPAATDGPDKQSHGMPIFGTTAASREIP